MKRTKIVIITLLLSFLTSLIIFNGCGKKEEKIKIGAILPLTGNLASLGEKESRMLKFIEYYINENKTFNPKIRIDIQDAKGDAKLAANIAQKFVIDGLEYVLISTTPLSAAALPILEKNNKVTIIHSMTNSLLNNTKHAVRIYPSIYDEILCLNKWFETKQFSKIFILRVRGEFSEIWVKEFKKSNPNIDIKDEEYTLTNLDIKNIISKIKIFSPNSIILLGYGSEYPQLLRQLKEFKIETLIYSNIGFAYSGNKEAAEKMNSLSLLQDIIFPMINIDVKDKHFKELDSLYFKKYNRSFLEEPGAIYYYDTIILLLEYLSSKNSKANEFRNFLANEKQKYIGITGEMKFLENGDTRIQLIPAKYNNNNQIQLIK